MFPIPAELLAKGKELGALTFEEVNAVMPQLADPEELVAIMEWFESQGIQLLDYSDDDDHPPTPNFDPLPLDEEKPRYHPSVEFEELLRTHGVPFSEVRCSFDVNGKVFDAVLVAPGEQALGAWLALRNIVHTTGMWPVLQDTMRTADLAVPREELDPGHHWVTWQLRKNRELPMPQLTPEIIRADAAANIALAERIPPTPWTFRNRGGSGPPAFTEPDSPLEPSTPNFAELFTNDGPFCAQRRAGPPGCPAEPFVRMRLYPTAVPWEVFAYTWSGGWNDCPMPEEQLSIIRHWHGQYGIEPVSHLGDWYEFFVPSPPRSRHQAERLLWEMGHFGEETFYAHGGWRHPDPIEAVRASHYWYFWWD